MRKCVEEIKIKSMIEMWNYVEENKIKSIKIWENA